MKLRRVANSFQCSIVVLGLLSSCPSLTMAQDEHTHATEQSKAALNQQNALVKIVRDSTERFKDVKVAEAEGYALQFGCVSGDDFGAMGLHYVNMNLVGSGVLDATRPQIVIYEPKPDGTLRLIGADYLLLVDAWKLNHSAPPELMGQFFHLFTSPNRFGLPDFYTLHVWAWKENPKGAFVNWHPNVSCASFGPKP
ncbi:MAG TPA: hypothetical protein VNX18_19240 [Bryobacteraceae bacterium]|nr:hypothetical protein [Bryobacteraceae bacterium]